MQTNEQIILLSPSDKLKSRKYNRERIIAFWAKRCLTYRFRFNIWPPGSFILHESHFSVCATITQPFKLILVFQIWQFWFSKPWLSPTKCTTLYYLRHNNNCHILPFFFTFVFLSFLPQFFLCRLMFCGKVIIESCDDIDDGGSWWWWLW